jgi:WD40 repeat protein
MRTRRLFLSQWPSLAAGCLGLALVFCPAWAAAQPIFLAPEVSPARPIRAALKPLGLPKPPAPQVTPHKIVETSPKRIIGSVALSPDGAIIALCCNGSASYNPLHLFTTATGQGVFAVKNGSSGLTWVAFAPDGTTFATGSGEKEPPRLWDAKTFQLLRAFEHKPPVLPPVLAVHLAYSADGKLLATAESNYRVCLWDTTTGKELASVPHHKWEKLYRVAFTPDGKTLASAAYYGGGVELHDLTGPPDQWAARKPKLTIETGIKHLVHVGFADAGRLVVTAGRKAPVQFWDAQTGKLHKELAVDKLFSEVQALALSADGRTLAVAGGGLWVVLYDLGTDKFTAALGPQSPAECVAISADGSWVAAGCNTGQGFLYHVPRKQP